MIHERLTKRAHQVEIGTCNQQRENRKDAQNPIVLIHHLQLNEKNSQPARDDVAPSNTVGYKSSRKEHKCTRSKKGQTIPLGW